MKLGFSNNSNSNTYGADSNQTKRIIVVVGGLVLIIIIAILFYALVFGNKKGSDEILLPVAGTQTDLIALTKLGNKSARDINILNHGQTVGLVVTTHNSVINGHLGKDAAKKTKAYQNTDYTAKLDAATGNGTFDATYETLLSQYLNLYRQKLVTAYSEVQDAKTKQEIAKMSAEASTLAGEPTAPN